MGRKHPHGHRYGRGVLGAVEVLGRLDFFKEIWVEPEKYTFQMVCILVAFVVLLVTVMVAARKSRRQPR